jgi:serpin B
MSDQRKTAAILCTVLCVGFLVTHACKKIEGEYSWGPLVPVILEADGGRDTDPDATGAELDLLVAGNTDFAFDLYGLLEEEAGGDNVFFSPHSISVCLAMVYAGAEGDTELAMAEAMSYDLEEPRLHPAFNALDLALDSRNSSTVDLSITNDVWIDQEFSVLDSYIEVVGAHYGAPVRILDFGGQPEPSRQTINRWVSHSTEGLIEEILAPGMIGPSTPMVLTNAIYFYGTWKYTFDRGTTYGSDFHLLGGGTVPVQMMIREENLRYTWDDGWAAVEVPYDGDELAMLVVLPDEGRYAEIEESLDRSFIESVDSGLYTELVNLRMPRFTMKTEYDLVEHLSTLGMAGAFGAGADFSGINGAGGLSIAEVVHMAYVAVDEEGTEAAAATGVSMDASVSISVDFRMDRPFLFLIRDRETGAILFMGRVLDPS